MHQPDTVPQRNIALVASEAIIEELRNVHLMHESTSSTVRQLRPLRRFAGLRKLTLCRVFGTSDSLAIGTTLRQLPTSLEVRRDVRACLSATRLMDGSRLPSAGRCRCFARLHALLSADRLCCVMVGMWSVRSQLVASAQAQCPASQPLLMLSPTRALAGAHA